MTTLTPLEQAERCLSRIAGSLEEGREPLRRGLRHGFARLMLLSHAASCLRSDGYAALAHQVEEARFGAGQPELDLLYRVRALVRKRSAMGRAA